MSISVDEFVKKYQNKSIDFDKAYGAQCVDLFNFYNREVVGAPWVGTPITGGARDLYQNIAGIPQDHYQRVAASEPPRVGDVAVYGEPWGRAVERGRTVFYGHVTIYLGNGRVLEQNGRISQKTTISKFTRSGLLGFLRPRKFLPKSNNSPQKQNTTTSATHKIAPGDTFWELENKYGIQHGRLQALNPTVDPRALKIGSIIKIKEEKKKHHAATKTYYEIRPGDTFWALEDAWRLPHGRLAGLNSGIDPRRLQVGQRIRRS